MKEGSRDLMAGNVAGMSKILTTLMTIVFVVVVGGFS